MKYKIKRATDSKFLGCIADYLKTKKELNVKLHNGEVLPFNYVYLTGTNPMIARNSNNTLFLYKL